MEASRKRRGSGPRVAGAIAGAFAFGLGVTALVYFVELRGSGIAVELSSVRGPELVIYAGAVVLLALVAFFTVAGAARGAGGEANLQALLQRAHDVDLTDVDALRAFDAVPPLRDLVAQLATEKAHVRELSDRLETLRGEFVGVAEGMRRSAQDLGHLREENLSGLAMQAVHLWNGLVDRLQHAQMQADPAVVGTLAHADPGQSDVTTLVTRLDELESELARLRDAMASPALPMAAPAPSATWTTDEPALEIESASEGWGEPETEAPAELATRWGMPEAHAVSEEPATISARELFIDESAFGPEEGFAQVAPEPQINRSETRRVADPFAPRSLLPDEFGAGAVDPRPAPRAAVPPPVPPPSASEFEGMRFPEFVGGRHQRPADKVDLTYESQTGDEVGELPASALLFDAEDDKPADDGVFDLRSFGATEFDK